jgi:hypothetical protein
MNRMQFQPGLSMAEFLEHYDSEAQCEGALVAARRPDGYVCSACGAGDHSTFVPCGRRSWQFTACRHQCSAMSGTKFAPTKLPLTLWLLAIQVLTHAKSNVADPELRCQLRVCCKTAELVKHRLLEVMPLREQARQPRSCVELGDVAERCSAESTAVSICQSSWRGRCGPPPSLCSNFWPSFVWIRNVATQVKS